MLSSDNLTTQTIRILDNELSLYTDDLLNIKGTTVAIAKLEKAFPDWDEQLTELLITRAKHHKFTNKRFMDAIDHVIDNYKYQKPHIADIISFDKKVKMYTYNEMLTICSNNNTLPTTDFFKSVLIQNKRVWVEKSDYVNYFDKKN